MSQSPDRKADFSRSGISRYIQLATLFRRRIDSGQWPVGQQIPTVDELAEESGVARSTIRQAVGLLESDGLVSRFRAKGTFVNARRQPQIWCDVETDWNGLLMSREGARIEILADQAGMPLPSTPHRLGTISPSYRHLRRRHSRDGKAFLLADVYIDEMLAKKIPEAAFTSKTALRLAASIPGINIADARQTLTIGTADMETAELLDMPLNAPVCLVDRSAVDQHGRLILIAIGIYRGDMVRMEIKLR
ncbi:MAG: GntR family transcriptional regulator [Phreatobacter sp.]